MHWWWAGEINGIAKELVVATDESFGQRLIHCSSSRCVVE
jgi:hypothetical protein